MYIPCVNNLNVAVHTDYINILVSVTITNVFIKSFSNLWPLPAAGGGAPTPLCRALSPISPTPVSPPTSVGSWWWSRRRRRRHSPLLPLVYNLLQ